jgi:hypothetical protein
VGAVTLGYIWPPQVRHCLFWAALRKGGGVTEQPTKKGQGIIHHTTTMDGEATLEDIALVTNNVHRLEETVDRLEDKLDRILAIFERETFQDESSVFQRSHCYSPPAVFS